MPCIHTYMHQTLYIHTLFSYSSRHTAQTYSTPKRAANIQTYIHTNIVPQDCAPKAIADACTCDANLAMLSRTKLSDICCPGSNTHKCASAVTKTSIHTMKQPTMLPL